ncbi:MAG: DUF4956 domain-containing protein [Pirellulaceae bacterium]
MYDWLASTSTEVQATAPTLVLRLLVAWLCGWIVAYLERRKMPPGAPDTLSLTLVLMCILIAMATQIIGDNIARAFSLVGALSIVRFRTAVPATRDVAYVLAAVVVGMAIGAGQYSVAALGLMTVALATQFNAPTAGTECATELVRGSWRLTMKVGLHSMDGWEAELERLTDSYQLISAETSRRGGALDLVYRYQPRTGIDATQLIAALNTIPNVESVSSKLVT